MNRQGSWRTSWRSLSSASRQLLLLGTGSTLLAVAVLGAMIWELRLNTIEDSRRTIRTLSLAIAEQTSRSLQGADVLLLDIRRQIDEQRMDSLDAFRTRLAGRDMFQVLQDRAGLLPQVNALSIIAADGWLVNASRGWPMPATDLAGRDYFQHFRTHDMPDAFVSMPVNNRINGRWTSYIARRVNAPSGEFLGIVVVALDLDYFRTFFQALVDPTANLAGGDPATTVTLSRRDGTVLTSYPDAVPPGRALPQPSLPPSDLGKAPAPLDPDARIAATRPLPDYPLVVEVSRSRDAALADWRQIGAMTGIATVITMLAVGLLIRAQLKQYRRLERSEQLHATRNAMLEATGATLRDQADELTAGRARFAEQSDTLQAALRHMNQGIIMVDARDRVVVCNERAAAMLELPAALIASQPSFGELTAFQQSIGEFDGPLAPIRRSSLAEATAGPRIYERTRPNGTVMEVQTVLMPDGGIVRTYTDVTERRRTEQQVQFLARHDGLTGLYNRTSLQDHLQALIGEADRTRQRLGIYYIDLDGFKLVNDTLGHAAGDELLRNAAHRLKAALRDSDVVARMGGDEFAVVQLFGGETGAVEDLAGRMLASVAEPYWLDDRACSVNLSLGVALYPDHGTDPAELLTKADMALYRAKAGGKGTWRLFDRAIDLERQSTYSLEKDLARAVAQQQFHVEYQPIVDARRRAVVRFEALLRWTHPVRGLVSPVEFIPMAERSGLIGQIGLWALETACAAAAAWPAEVGVAVNLSPVQLSRGNLVEDVGQILARTGLAASRLNLEITEGVLLENTRHVHATMQRLHRMGIRFSLDDFGTAHAGLSYLRNFSFDVLKIDKSFVRDAAGTGRGRGVLAAIQAIGVACGMRVVAEGVETETELALVQDLGCHEVQGYLFGQPAREVAFELAAG